MTNNQEIKKVEGWARKVQPFCCYLRWRREEETASACYVCKPRGQRDKCAYRNCPKL